MTETSVAALELVIPGFVPDSRLSLNGRHRTHWTVVRKLREAVVRELDNVILVRLAERRPVPRFTRARVQVTFVYPVRRRRDPDGLAGLAKPLLDDLVLWGIVPDDDSAHVELDVTARVEPGITETRVRLEEQVELAS